ncbi:hypothetical protein BDN72DRAFT_833064 [Pluteus cervinus]|uniref:Uncharacterized protein n=1 Tax=Pluteus cervinus TaxID=181527 RepID=A0ACD3B985_9AGAR|nr:hypothetical protein BDN72DRAFT_833064 [Pluteus cervinus]
MQFKFIAVCVISCMTALVAAAPTPVTPPLDVEARVIPNPSRRDVDAPVAREPEPEPICRYGCY